MCRVGYSFSDGVVRLAEAHPQNLVGEGSRCLVGPAGRRLNYTLYVYTQVQYFGGLRPTWDQVGVGSEGAKRKHGTNIFFAC